MRGVGRVGVVRGVGCFRVSELRFSGFSRISRVTRIIRVISVLRDDRVA